MDFRSDGDRKVCPEAFRTAFEDASVRAMLDKQTECKMREEAFQESLGESDSRDTRAAYSLMKERF
jgi:hypothetical protein